MANKRKAVWYNNLERYYVKASQEERRGKYASGRKNRDC